MNDNRDEKRKGRRAWYIAFGVVALMIALLILWMVVRDDAVERRLEALRAQGYPTSLAELAEQHQLPAGAKNAADTYALAFGAFVRAKDSARALFIGEGDLPLRGEPLPEETRQATERFLLDNQACLDRLREAGAIEYCHYDWDYAQGMPDLMSVRKCMQLLSCGIVLRGYEGESAAALNYFADGLRLVDSLANEPILICYLVRVACTALDINALEQALSATPFTDDQLVELGRLLTEIATTLDLRRALIGERCCMIEYMRDPSLLTGGNTSVVKIPGLGKLGFSDILDYMADCIEACELPPAERLKRFHEISDELEQLSVLHIVAKTLAPALGRVAELDVRCKAEIEVARTALAVERYRLATGAIPSDLESLVPDYLDCVPIDPYDGQPVHYLRETVGYRLYHVGDDSRDNGGLGKDEVNRGDPYDWPFVVAR